MRGIFYLYIYINGIKYYYNTSRKLSVRGKVLSYKHIYYPIHHASKLDKEKRFDYAEVIDDKGKVWFLIDNRKEKKIVCNVPSKTW